MPRWALCLLVALWGCGQQPARENRPLKIGYVVNYMSHEWYQNICSAAQRRAREMGVDLVIADANLDVAAQISKAENLIAQGVDVLVLTPVDSKAMGTLVRQAKEAGIQVVTESNRVPGVATYVGIDDHASGRKAGLWFAAYARDQQIDPKILLVGLPYLEACRQRVAGFLAGLDEAGLPYEVVQAVDGQGLKEQAFRMAQDALTAHPEINVIYGINDDSTTGGMAAYRAAGLDEDKLTAIGFGFEGVVGRTALLGDTPYKAALAMFPDFVGVSLVEVAVRLSRGEKLPDHYETPTLMITRESFGRFYRTEGEGYTMDLGAVRALME
ncbi:MAG: substrate-binding domain-containing protein [Gemmatimonadota bacterium]